jgi:hypothetical protein
MSFERVLRWALVAIAVTGLAAGIAAHAVHRTDLADLFWTLATAPVVVGLAVSILGDLLAGRFGVDAIALVSMSAALVLGQPLAGAVVALMYSGGNVLEDIARHARRIAVSTSVSKMCRYPRLPSATGFWCGLARSFP